MALYRSTCGRLRSDRTSTRTIWSCTSRQPAILMAFDSLTVRSPVVAQRIVTYVLVSYPVD